MAVAVGGKHNNNNNNNPDEQAHDFRQGMQVLDWDARVFYYPNFLSSEEVDFLLVRGFALLQNKHGALWRTQPRVMVYYEGKDKEHPIIRQIEEKVSLATLIPPHSDELDLMLSYTAPIPFDKQGNEFTNIHHDTNGAENRVMTVVIYLTNVTRGGHTVFPALGDPKLGEHQINRDLSKTFTHAYVEENRRVLFTPPHWNDTAVRLVNEICREKYPALRVRPIRGSAVVFASRFADGHSDARMWHAACAVKEGEKFTLQKFKEFDRHSGEWVMDEWTREEGSRFPPRWQEF